MSLYHNYNVFYVEDSITGITYDSGLGITEEALVNRFAELHERMEYYADFPIRNYSLASPPKLKITIREFTFGLVCTFFEHNIHVIVSLTTCTIAQLIEEQTIPYGIPHIAIPRPTCSNKIINYLNNKTTTTTIWIQPTPEQTGRAIYEMSEMERASLSLLLLDKPNLETNSALDFVLQSEINDEKFVPYFSTQMFSLTNQSNPMYPTSNSYDTIDVLLKRFQQMKLKSSTFLLSHIFHIQVRPLDLDQLYNIFQNRFIFRNFYWIFPTTLTITPNDLIRVSTTNQLEQVATGFFRQFPILNEEDCLNLNIGENMRLLMSEIFKCNTNNITERELEAVYMILLSSQATILMKSLSIDFLNISSISNCDATPLQPRPYGQLFYRILVNLAELPKWKNLLFYSLETDVNGKSTFLPTGNFSENGDIALSDYGQVVAKQGLLSGLFPNTFRSFQNKTINISTSFRTDMIAAPLTINKERSEEIFFVGPFMEDTLGMLINVPEQREELFQVFLPFRYDIWLCLLSAVFVAAFLITIFSIISPFSAWNLALPGATSDEVSIFHSIWFTVGGMLMQGQELRAIACSARTITLLYWLLVLVIQATWQADLTAFLTRNVIQVPVSSLEDLASSSLSLAAVKNSGTVKMFQTATANEFQSNIYRRIMENPTILNNLQEAIAYVRNSTKNVVLDDRIQLMHSLPENEEALTVVDDKKVIVPFGFAVRLGEEYAPLMLNFMSILRERGVIDHLLEKWNVEKIKDTSNVATFNLVTLRNMAGAFIVLAVFVVTSLIVLVIEIQWHKHSLKKAKLHPESKKPTDGHPSLWRRFTHPSEEIPKPKLDLSRNPTLKQLRYAGHRRASAAFDATVITAENQTESNLE
ncbi:unnamed protein product [Schistosoma turkestanicum]|nr:unnamed protein product [Schistosoma turkestanicum]